MFLNQQPRYEREVNRAQRSALKIILERDESSSRHMVLCVAAIRSYGEALSELPRTTPSPSTAILFLPSTYFPFSTNLRQQLPQLPRMAKLLQRKPQLHEHKEA